MSHTLYASFTNPDDAERAAGALIDQGVRSEDLSVVRQHTDEASPATGEASWSVAAIPASVAPTTSGSASGVLAGGTDGATADDALGQKAAAPSGEAGAGAVKGTMIGVGLGAIAAIAALVIPGVGFVLGAGALASALGGIAATAGAGAAAGAIVGYLKEMGVDDEAASEYGQAVEGGGAVLAVTVPSGTVDEEAASTILKHHAATNINRYAGRGGVA